MQNEDYVGIYPSKQSWHIEPFGKYTKRCLLEMLPETFYSYGVMCGDGESHDLLPVNEECAKEFGAMGKGDVKLSFRIWHRNGQARLCCGGAIITTRCP